MSDGAMIYDFRASITDIRSFVEAATAFPYKIRTGLVTGRTGSVIESALMIPVTMTVSPDFFGDGDRAFAQVLGDLFEREALV